MRILWLWPVVLLLAACVSNPSGSSTAVSEQAVSQQASTNESRERARIHTELGSLYLNDGRVGVAMEEATIALNADSSYAAAYSLMGLAHMYLQENGAAEENLKKALSLAPGDPEINNNLGWFLCQTGREADAIAHFMAAIKNPHYTTPARSFTNAAICSLRMKKTREAEEYFVRALRSDPQQILAIYGLADIYYLSGRNLEARQFIAELHRLIDPTSQSLWLALRIERRLGNREAEARHASQLRRRFSESAEFQKLKQGNFE